MSKTKESGQATTSISTVGGHVVKAGMTEVSSCILVGIRISNGAAFQRGFPTVTALNSWLATGDGSDIEVTRVVQTGSFGG